MLYRSGLYHMEFRIWLAGNPPVALISVIRSINLSNRLFLNGNALKRLDGDNRRHTDALSGLDRSAQSGAVDVLTDNIRHMLLADGADGKAQLACQSR